MNPALDKLYNELLLEADDEEPVEEVSDAERSRRWQEDKQVVIEKLKAINMKKLEEESRRKENARMQELERKRQAAIENRIKQEKQEKLMIRDMEANTVRFWKRDITGKRRETGVLYFGESKRHGDAWVPHGYGEYRVHGETIYEGRFRDGAMHGEGRLLFDTGETWAGQLWKDMVHGMGTLISEDNEKRRAIYWRDRRVCFIEELTPGCRLQLLGDQFVRNNGGEAIVVADTDRLWRYRLRLDSGSEILVRLDSERFRLLRHKPKVIPLDTVVGSTRCKDLYDYDHDQSHPQTSAHRENFYWPDLWAAREKAQQEKQAELDLETKRSQILARRQVQRDADKAADQAVDVAKGLEDERRRQEDLKREDAEATEKGKEALEAARVKAEAEKKRRKDLSKSPPHKR
eukprot:jgi/Undpi1/10139/HiC_scaffold_28.g12593.m1